MGLLGHHLVPDRFLQVSPECRVRTPALALVFLPATPGSSQQILSQDSLRTQLGGDSWTYDEPCIKTARSMIWAIDRARTPLAQPAEEEPRSSLTSYTHYRRMPTPPPAAFPTFGLGYKCRGASGPSVLTTVSLLHQSVCLNYYGNPTPKERDMPAAPDPGHLEALGLIALLIASVCVVYWRIVLQLLAIAVLAVAIYTAVLLIEGFHGAVP